MLPIHVPFIWEGLSDLDPRDRGQTLIPACSVFTVSSSKGEHGGTCKPRCLHLGGRRVSNMVFVFCVFLRGLIMLHVFPWPRTKYNLDDCPRGSCQLVTPYELWPQTNIPLPLRNPPANCSTIILPFTSLILPPAFFTFNSKPCRFSFRPADLPHRPFPWELKTGLFQIKGIHAITLSTFTLTCVECLYGLACSSPTQRWSSEVHNTSVCRRVNKITRMKAAKAGALFSLVELETIWLNTAI